MLESGHSIAALLQASGHLLILRLKPVVTAQLTKWTSGQLMEIVERLISTEIQLKTVSMANPSTLTGQTLLGIVFAVADLRVKRIIWFAQANFS